MVIINSGEHFQAAMDGLENESYSDVCHDLYLLPFLVERSKGFLCTHSMKCNLFCNWFHLSFSGRLVMLFLRSTSLFTSITIMRSLICSCVLLSLYLLDLFFPIRSCQMSLFVILFLMNLFVIFFNVYCLSYFTVCWLVVSISSWL